MRTFQSTVAWAVVLAATAGPVEAAPIHDLFNVQLNEDNTVTPNTTPGANTGFDNGTWYEYTDPDGGPNWWNQWFFNGPDILGSKWITWDIFSEGDPRDTFEVAINYSTPTWLDPDSPPLPGNPPDANDFIVRESIFIGAPNNAFNNLTNPFLIPDFNPIWVSIDIRMLNSVSGGPMFVGGQIWHEHHSPAVPEPSTFALLGIGSVCMAFVGVRRRRKNKAA